MFAVKGWNVSAPLKTQTEPTKPVKQSNGTGENGLSKGQKRKRAERSKKGKSLAKGANAEELNEDALAERLKKAKEERDAASAEGRKKRKIDVDEDGDEGRDGDRVKRAKTTTMKETKKEKTVGKTDGENSVDNDPPRTKKQKKRDKRDIESNAPEVRQEDGNDTLLMPKKPELKTKEATSDARTNGQPPIPKSASRLTPLQASMRAKLASARFRHLNETLYTSPSDKALDLFTKNPEMFTEYHEGFRQQVDVWPENPVDGYIADIRRRSGSGKGTKVLPRTKGLCTIADLGCGDAKLASSLQRDSGKLNIKVLSYDLTSPSPLVVRADISNLPLEDGSVNVAIFCLALMGTNWTAFIDEACRILHWKGELWVAEIKSRFGRAEKSKDKVVDHSVGKQRKKSRAKMSEKERRAEDDARKDEDQTLAIEVDEASAANTAASGNDQTDVSSFIKVLATRGFVLDGEEKEAVERGNKMFVKMRFLKAAQPTKGKNAVRGKEGSTWKPKGKKFLQREDGEEVDETKVLKPCVYKLR